MHVHMLRCMMSAFHILYLLYAIFTNIFVFFNFPSWNIFFILLETPNHKLYNCFEIQIQSQSIEVNKYTKPKTSNRTLWKRVESLSIELCSVLAGISLHKRVDSEDIVVDFETSCPFEAKKWGQNNTRLKSGELQNTVPDNEDNATGC